MHICTLRTYASLIAITSGALISAPAFAQQTSESAGAETTAIPADAGEIIVTAQKRNENVQDVPVSVAAFSGATLEKNQCRNRA